MPLQRRLPKRGFVSLTKCFNAEVTTRDLNRLPVDEIDLAALLQAGLVPQGTRQVKIVLNGEITRAIKLQGIGVTKGAKSAIEAAGGNVA